MKDEALQPDEGMVPVRGAIGAGSRKAWVKPQFERESLKNALSGGSGNEDVTNSS